MTTLVGRVSSHPSFHVGGGTVSTSQMSRGKDITLAPENTFL